ncbi:hypothetical protein BHE74_00018010, partial [Ensete ventricosum]
LYMYLQTIEKLEKMVDACNFYEAQQMYKSSSARWSFLLVVLLVIKVRNFGLYRYWSVRYLSQGNLRDANNFMDELKKQLEQKQLEIPHSDLIQVIGYLLRT